MKDVAGKVAVVTGGVSGVGLGIAKAFAAAGMKVAITYRRADHRDQAMAYFATQPAQTVHPVAIDVTDRASLARGAEEIDRVFGKVHVLCNNAGVNLFGTPSHEATPADWQWIFGVNLFGAVNALDTFLPRIRAHGEGGHVVNVGSMASFVSGPRSGVYTASKFALRGYTECLRYDLAKERIGVSLVCPGLTQGNGHEAIRSRPAELAGRPLDERLEARLAQAFAAGMDPVEVGRKTLAGMLRNQLYVLTHPDHREEIAELHREISAAFPDEPLDAGRQVIETHRRNAIADAKRLADAIGEDT